MPVSSIPGVGLIPSAAKNANGSTNTHGLTVRGVPMTSTQQKVAEALLGVCDQNKAGSIASEAIIFASIAESNLGENMGPSSAGFVGALQGSPTNGFTTASVTDEAHYFLVGGKGYHPDPGGALALVRGGATDPIAIAVTVEVPDGGAGYGYSREAGYDGPGWLAESKAIVAGVGGMAVKGGVAGLGGTGTVVNGSPGSTYKFQIGGTDNPDEDFWTGCNRLAQEVNWYLFTNGEMLYYMDGQEMIAQKPALYLDRVRDASRLSTPLSLAYDNTSYNSVSDHKRRFTTQRKAALVKMSSPTQVMFDLICGIDEIRAGDVIVMTSFGPGDGRWIVGDCPLALDTPIPTPSGWSTMGQLSVGDEVLGADGKPARVLTTSRVHHDRECYRVRFNDGTSIVADAGHLWETTSYLKGQKSGDRSEGGWTGVVTTDEIRQSLLRGPRTPARNHRIRLAPPIKLPEVSLPVDPYVLGYWLGDGSSTSGRITTSGQDLDSLRCEIERAGFRCVAREYIATGYSAGAAYYSVSPLVYSAKCACGRAVMARGLCSTHYSRLHRNRLPLPSKQPHNGMVRRLREIGVLGNKHIPMSYLRASDEQRLALLQGLMDSDGTMGADNCALSLRDERLARDALELVRTLGFRPHWHVLPPRGSPKNEYRVTFATRAHANPFRLERKAAAYSRQLASKQCASHHGRSVVAVEPVASVPVRCIGVDTADHLFLAGEGFCPTHNTRSVFATYSSITLVPPIAPMSEVAVAGATGTSSKTGTSTAASSPGGVALAGTLRAKVVQVARAAIAREAKSGAYSYAEVRPYPSSLFGPAPVPSIDCSSFSILCYKDAGAPDPNGTGFDGSGSTFSLIARGTAVQTPQPGDLVFYSPPNVGTNGHVAVYLGNGQIANMGAPNAGEPIAESVNIYPISAVRSYL